MTLRVLHAADYRRMRWKNGGGWTTELAVYPSGSDSYDWRISIAEIESSGPFSVFPGYDRAIALLAGIGMELRCEGRDAVRLEQRLHFVSFSGDAATQGVLISGPVRDFNVISRRDAVRAEVLHRPLVGPMVFFPNATWFVYLADGHAEVKCGGEQHALQAGASMLLRCAPDAQRAVLNGGGEVVVVKITPVSQAAE